MKSINDFKAFFNSELYPKLHILEQQRLKIRNTILIKIAVYVLISIIISTLLMIYDSGNPFVNKSNLALFFLAIGIVAYKDITKTFVNTFKHEIINDIAKFIDPSLNLVEDIEITATQLNNAEIFPKNPDNIYISDFFDGQIGETYIDFCELMLEKVTEDEKDVHSRITFKGYYLIADFNKDFKGITIVSPDLVSKRLGKVGELIRDKFSDDTLVKLEDIEFEKEFVVHSNDQVEARYILSPSLMKKILNLKKHTGSDIGICFIDSNLHLAIPHRKNRFEPKIFKSIINYKEIEEFFLDFMYFIDIIDDLNLNNRLWTKE